LVEFKARREQRIQKGFYQTAIVKKVWAVWIRSHPKKMVVVDGREGRGSLWLPGGIAIALGQMRYVSLDGMSNKTFGLRAIADALGSLLATAEPSRIANADKGRGEALRPNPGRG